MTTRRKKPARRPVKRTPARKTMALTVRGRSLPSAVMPTAILPTDPHILGEDAATGALGLVELKFTKAEELVLSEPVPLGDIRIKPTGQAYLSHPSYTRWLNRAFGRGGWSLVPRTRPVINDNLVLVSYLLYVHGKPLAFCYGEQEYHPTNKEQTYGDVIEATIASALRRCAKRLGVGLEMWDKEFLNAWMAQHAIAVLVPDRNGEERVCWRRRVDPPLLHERGASTTIPYAKEIPMSQQQQQTSAAPTERSHVGDTRPITVVGRDGKGRGQLGRLIMIASKAGRTDREVKEWLFDVYGWTSKKQITREHYNDICERLEAPGPLVATREPGSDDQ